MASTVTINTHMVDTYCCTVLQENIHVAPQKNKTSLWAKASVKQTCFQQMLKACIIVIVTAVLNLSFSLQCN